ncbi:MAG: gliding motility protein GldN [Bacteroidetes bacterium]|nr:gliding motility protein GldN [Fibrella sp.]
MKQGKTIRIDVAMATAAALLTVAVGGAMAQEKANNGVNPLSVRPINDGDIMMKKTLWRRIDLREKQNQSLFSKNNEISRYLIDAVKAGLLDAYPNDSVATKFEVAKFNEKLLMPNTGGGLSAEEIAAGFKADGTTGSDGFDAPKKDGVAAKKPVDDGWGTPAPKKTAVVDDGWGAPAPKKKTAVAAKKGKKGAKTVAPVVPKDTVAVAAVAAPLGDEYFANQLNILELREDWIFDKKRSRLYYDIQTVALYLPADANPAGLEIPVAYFKYKDLDKLFRSDPKKFIWYNPQNQAQHRNLADAFDLRLFYGRITKVANPADKDLLSQYGTREGLLKSYQLENELMETEHGLWEY